VRSSAFQTDGEDFFLGPQLLSKWNNFFFFFLIGDLLGRNYYFEGHETYSMLAEFLRVLEEKENGGIEVICGFKQFQPSIASHIKFWLD
jgi:hypothetical protein